MAERPLLILPTPGQRPRAKKPAGGGKTHYPSARRQAERLEPQFKAVQKALDDRRTRLQASDAAVIPEEVVVFDIRGTVDDFLRAVRGVPDLEWLGEVDAGDIEADEDFFVPDQEGRRQEKKMLSRRLFMVFSNHDAHDGMIRLFRRFEKGRALPPGLAPWKHLFAQLKSVRPWNAADRLFESGLEAALEEGVGSQTLACELELWFRREAGRRTDARRRVETLLDEQGGAVLSTCVIPEIRYHAMSVRLPVTVVRRLVPDYTGDIALVECEQLQYLRAAGQTTVSVGEGETKPLPPRELPEPPTGTPVVALLDGLPLAGHDRLRKRLIVDDPDGWEQGYPANRRRHGTAMASLIVHGDLGASREPVSRRLYARPILGPDPHDPQERNECCPIGTLVPDLIHRAVRRLFEDTASERAAAPEVSVVNLSIGLRNRLFTRSLSPLARLLDWLAWKYKVLFIVSAGNHSPPRMPASPSPSAPDLLFEKPQIQRDLLRALAADTSGRRLLSPAESMNALTIGAEHADASDATPFGRWMDPYVAPGLPSPISAHGMGFRRSIKPDLLMPGGRVPVRQDLTHPERLDDYRGILAPGQLVAVPGARPGHTDHTGFTRGTSNATALATRDAGFFHDLLDALRKESGGAVIDEVPRSIWIKTLLAHGADWGLALGTLDRALTDPSVRGKFREFISRIIGYGFGNAERVRECTRHRVVGLGGGGLRAGESHIHRIPVPKAVRGNGVGKALTVTLSWMTPVNPMHQGWRRADLWFDVGSQKLARKQADSRATQRGTVQHEVWQGTQALPRSGSNIEVQVNCREDAGTLEDAVPYALAVTLEVAENLRIDLYGQVRAAIEAMRAAIPARN